MYSWNIVDGVSEMICSPQVPPKPSLKIMPGTGSKSKQNAESFPSLEWLNICASTHPTMCYLTAGTDLYGLDMRSAAAPRLVFSDVSRLASLSHHTVSTNHLFVSNASRFIGLLDLRYPKRYTVQKAIYDNASSMHFQSTLDFQHPDHSVQTILHHDMSGILLTRSKKAKQILIHSFDLGMHDDNIERNSAIFSMSRPFETANSMAHIETSGVPIIDQHSPHDRNCGAVIVPYFGTFTGYKEGEEKDGNKVQSIYNAIVMHQSYLGDVHAQRVFVTSPQQTWGYAKRSSDGQPLNQKYNSTLGTKNLRVDTDAELGVPLKFSRRNHSDRGDTTGLSLTNNLFDIDCDMDEYPISRSEIVPALQENDMASHEIIDEGPSKSEDDDLLGLRYGLHQGASYY